MITNEEVERFAEEGIRSLPDAFVPTARLFFNTNRSMQQICDWQDQALLRVYFGDVRAVRAGRGERCASVSPASPCNQGLPAT